MGVRIVVDEQINKLFIIGNGFDLAHGLKTSYNDFINDFWKNEKTKILTSNNFIRNINDYSYIYDDDILNIHTPQIISQLPDGYLSHDAKGYQWFKYLISSNASSKWSFSGVKSSKVVMTIKNTFLQNISEKYYLQNWVDIEGEYYRLLKNCLKIENENPTKSVYNVDKLNDDFFEIRNMLELYLSYNANNRIGKIPQILDKFRKIIQPELFSGQNKINEKDNILFLNFNYTNTENEYLDFLKVEIPQEINCIHIHGEIDNKKNPIIFGYGDELDEEYLKIENKKDDRYLENVKSMKYLQTPNYSNLLRFIESNEYDVFIMGHSCGISDRTLLNTIFENENCRSIKIFYYKKLDETDDYTEKIMNITRNFKHKPSMRKKVIDKTNCEPLI